MTFFVLLYRLNFFSSFYIHFGLNLKVGRSAIKSKIRCRGRLIPVYPISKKRTFCTKYKLRHLSRFASLFKKLKVVNIFKKISTLCYLYYLNLMIKAPLLLYCRYFPIWVIFVFNLIYIYIDKFLVNFKMGEG